MKKTKNEVMPKGSANSKEIRFDIISLIIAVISLIFTVFIGFKANEIAIRSQPLDYSVTSNAHVGAVIVDGKPFTTEGIIFKQEKGVWSGDLSSVFLATVVDDSVDIVYVPDKMDDEFGFGHSVNNKIVYHIPADNPNKLLFGPNGITAEEISAKPQTFHLIFKGYNREYTIYTIVFTMGSMAAYESIENQVVDSSLSLEFGCFNIYVLDEDSMYDHTTLQSIADDINSGKDENTKYTFREILDEISAERNLCYQKLIDVN